MRAGERRDQRQRLSVAPDHRTHCLIGTEILGALDIEQRGKLGARAVDAALDGADRARSKLAALLYVDGAEDFGPDETVRAVIGGNG